MHYLKCDQCGHLNEAKTEYLTFCNACNKRIENNYSAWKLRNPERSYNDFLNMVCVSEAELSKLAAKTKPKSKKIKYWIGFTVAMVLFTLIGQYGGEAIVKFFRNQQLHQDVLQQEWVTTTYEGGLRVETPFKLNQQQLDVPDEMKQIMVGHFTYAYTTSNVFAIVINIFEYNRDLLETVSLQGAADGSINEVKMMAGITHLKYQEEKIRVDGVDGISQKGSAKENGIPLMFINTVFERNHVLYQLMVIHKEEDAVGKAAAGRIYESISFLP
jgi:hypothetical protein